MGLGQALARDLDREPVGRPSRPRSGSSPSRRSRRRWRSAPCRAGAHHEAAIAAVAAGGDGGDLADVADDAGEHDPLTMPALCQLSTVSRLQSTGRNQPEPGREIQPVEAQMRRPQSGRRRPGPPCPVTGDAVDQAGLQEGRGDLAAAFDQHAGRIRARQAPVAAAATSTRPSPPAATSMISIPVLRKDSRLRRCGTGVNRSHTGTCRAVVASFDVSARPGLRIEDDAHRRIAHEPRQAAGEIGIVGRDRAGADQDGVMMARNRWPSARAASPVIHLLSPDAVAMRPSSDDASLRWNERPASAHAQQEAGVDLGRLAARPRPPRRRSPLRAAGHGPGHSRVGFGSSIAETTRATPAARVRRHKAATCRNASRARASHRPWPHAPRRRPCRARRLRRADGRHPACGRAR